MQTRRRIIEAATRRFAQQGFKGTRLDDIADDVGLTKTAVLKHFGSKDDLMFEVHRDAALSFEGFLDAPRRVLDRGFFEVLRYWLLRSGMLRTEHQEQYRVLLLGWHSTEADLQAKIRRFWLMEDPESTLDFVEFGKRRGEIREELDTSVVAAMIDWVAEGLQGSLAATELDRGGLFHGKNDDEERLAAAVEDIVSMLRGALSPSPAGSA